MNLHRKGITGIGVGIVSIWIAGVCITCDFLFFHDHFSYVNLMVWVFCLAFLVTGVVLIKCGLSFVQLETDVKQLNHTGFMKNISRYKNWELLFIEKNISNDNVCREPVFKELNNRGLISDMEMKNSKIEYILNMKDDASFLDLTSGHDYISATNIFLHIIRKDPFRSDIALKIKDINDVMIVPFIPFTTEVRIRIGCRNNTDACYCVLSECDAKALVKLLVSFGIILKKYTWTDQFLRKPYTDHEA